jgi:hypothetical protein
MNSVAFERWPLPVRIWPNSFTSYGSLNGKNTLVGSSGLLITFLRKEKETDAMPKKSAQQLKAELELLDTVEVEAAPKTTGERDIFGFIPDPNYKSKPLLQPQNDPDFHPSVFRIGLKDKRHNEPMAAPPFQYPNPGAEYPEGLLREACKYNTDRDTANRNLRDVIMLGAFALKAGGIDRVNWSTINGVNQAPIHRAQAWAWLMGYWAGLAIIPPSEDQMQIWATEYAIERLHCSADELTKPAKQSPATSEPNGTGQTKGWVK